MSLFDRLITKHLTAKAPSPKVAQRPAVEPEPRRVEASGAKPAPVKLVPRGSCKAVNPATGHRCALLAGHTQHHRHGSTEFAFGAAPGETHFSRRAALDQLASARSNSLFTSSQGD